MKAQGMRGGEVDGKSGPQFELPYPRRKEGLNVAR
ncbi:hypothetical protein ES703_46958 [subsurface metagenome]